MLNLKHIKVYAGLFAVLSVIYLPVWQMDYAHLDDYRYFERIPHQWTIHALYPINVPIGRFVGVCIATVLGWMVDSLSDLTVIRLINIGMVSFCALILLQAFRRISFNSLQAFLSAVIICTLPPFQSMIPCAGHTFNLAAAFFASLAAATLFLTNTRQRNVSVSKAAIAASITLMVLALSTHQSIAMFYWALTGCFLVSVWLHDKPRFKIFLGISVGSGIASMIIYALILQAMKSHFPQEPLGMYNPYLFHHNYAHKLTWFFAEPLFNSLNLWNIFPRAVMAYGVGTFIITSAAWYAIRSFRKSSTLHSFKKLLYVGILFCAFVFLSFSTNLIAVGDAPWYRCCIGLTTLIAAVLILSISEWLMLVTASLRAITLTIILSIVSVAGAYWAYQTVLCQRVLPSHLEYTFIKKAIQNGGLENYNRVHLIRPTTALLSDRYDEFGLLTLDVPNTGIVPMLLCIIREIALENRLIVVHQAVDRQNVVLSFQFQSTINKNAFFQYSLRLTNTYEGEIIDPKPGTLVIDLTQLREVFRELNTRGFRLVQKSEN